MFLKVFQLIFDFIVYVLFAIVIGLWWIPALAKNDYGISFLRATIALVIVSGMFYKSVIVARRSHSSLHFCFYWVFAALTVGGYLYGAFFKWP
jgi:hypothetical protein